MCAPEAPFRVLPTRDGRRTRLPLEAERRPLHEVDLATAPGTLDLRVEKRRNRDKRGQVRQPRAQRVAAVRALRRVHAAARARLLRSQVYHEPTDENGCQGGGEAGELVRASSGGRAA